MDFITQGLGYSQKCGWISLKVFRHTLGTPVAAVWAQDNSAPNADLPAAVIIHDEGGPVQIGQSATATSFLPEGVAAPW
ncbi:MAG: hypothetical protein R2911_03005 [Caldilineaceae bacterium]